VVDYLGSMADSANADGQRFRGRLSQREARLIASKVITFNIKRLAFGQLQLASAANKQRAHGKYLSPRSARRNGVATAIGTATICANDRPLNVVILTTR